MGTQIPSHEVATSEKGLPQSMVSITLVSIRINQQKHDSKESRVTKKPKNSDNNWIKTFLENKGHEYYCEIDKDYITDRFNLTGLNTEVQKHFNEALNLMTDKLDEASFDDTTKISIDKAACHLYGLIHARYVITLRGLSKMLDKYNKADFDKCPRVLCNEQPLLPVGLSDTAAKIPVKLFCPRCQDIYNPKLVHHETIDGAYFGTSFPHMLLQSHPDILPDQVIQRYEPRIFGFKLHKIAQEQRYKDKTDQNYNELYKK
ncbi:hypothetical protein K501DRAFT_331100 [Backusella circina FSU 941]|nr:hypothetical protein K501DRAFT_331100 [Backusella circina FSU 941]